ncbi:MAG TPA: S8 family serine peptidase [Baekduia sp.]
MPAAVGGRAADAPALAGVRAAGGVVRARRFRRAAVARLLGLGLIAPAVLAAPSAYAEEIFTSQAAAAGATDSTWIPAPAVPVAVCIVDTGNDANPDTTNVVARLAVDDGDGADLGATKHGTLMSMIAAAPYNQFGMVGIAPSIEVVSVRATRSGDGFTFADVLKGIDACRLWRMTYNIKVISLSLGAPNTGPLDRATEQAMGDAVDSARAAGMDVVAAAGNHPGVVDWPAAYEPVLAVGAADDTGTRCSFAAAGPQVDLWAPGCPQDVALPDGRAAWASGSSEATALTAAVLAQLRSLRPDLAVDGAEAVLRSNAYAQQAGSTLDADSAFRAAGLSDQLAHGHRSIPDLSPTTGASSLNAAEAPQPGSPSPPLVVARLPAATPPVMLPRMTTTKPRERLPRPLVRAVRVSHGLLTLIFKNKGKGIQAHVDLYTRKRGRAFPTVTRRLRVDGARLRTRFSGTLAEVSITYRDPKAIKGMSAPLSLHLQS